MAASISGKVINAAGGVTPGLTVQAVRGGQPTNATTDNSGNYHITNLSAGTYTVLVIPSQGTYTPPNHSVTLTQNQNVAERNFRQIVVR
jgi:Carboxypeptidase regulatory-like domain